MLKRNTLIASVLLLTSQFIFSNPVQANDNTAQETTADSSTFTVGAQIRPRFEFRNGFKRPIADTMKPGAFIEQRSRIWFDFKNSKFHVHLNLQDVRMWGSTNQIYKSDPSLFNAYEAYAEYFVNDKWAIKFGRQALDYDNARFLGNLDWAQQGRSHDAILFKYRNADKTFNLHFGGGMNQFQNEPSYLTYTPYLNANNKWMAFAWANKDWGKFSSSFLVHNDGREVAADTSIANRQTIGVLPTYKTDKWKFNGEFYYQMGQNGGAQDVNAYFAGINATYKTDLTPITLGFEIASGTAYDADANVDNAWNPLYGTNHKFYGLMDYFYVGNGHGQLGRTSGLTDIYLKTNFKLGSSNKHSLMAHFHYFMSPVDIFDPTNPTENLSSGLGTEIDLVYKVVLTKGVVGNVGYSQMFITDSMKAIKGVSGMDSPFNNWVWAQINFNTNLFTFKH